MDRIIILSDICTFNRIGMTRYAGPYVIATRLRALGYDVRVVDWFTHHPDPLRLIEPLITRDTVAVCLSTTFLIRDPFEGMTPEERNQALRGVGRRQNYIAYKNSALWHSTVEESADWFRALRRLLSVRAHPDAKIVLGGARVPHFYLSRPGRIEDFLPEVDYGLIGAADDSVVHLFDDLRQGRRPMGEVRGGVCFIKPGLVRNQCPAIEFVPADAIQSGESLPVEMKRGCAYNCKFCHYEKRGATMKDPGTLRDELLRNYDRFGTTLYTFSDDCFNDTRQNVDSVCDTLSRLPFRIEWVSYARADISIKYPDTMAAMIESGCRGLFFGIETFNYAAGRAAGKGVPPDRVKQFLLDTMVRYGDRCLIECSFIAGLPHETDQSMSETIEWINSNRAMHVFDISPLGLYEYNEDLDHEVIDYADYSRNPEKYGFEMIQNGPLTYWKHATMDIVGARKWAATAMNRWYSDKNPPFRNMWGYPTYRALGFTHEEILSRLPLPDGWTINNEARPRWKAHSERYWNQLQSFGDPV